MGIPFYFATLIKNHVGICSSVIEKQYVDFFGIDFNCLIHQYLNDDEPINSVINALQHILDHICTGNTVYIAMA